jgi:aryl-alcohol dehydrogenase-like predicted oxidoreductase
MRYRRLGRTGLLVSNLALGTNMFGGRSDSSRAYGALDATEVAKTLATAIDCGINLIDTADVYGGGDAEALIGAAFSEPGFDRTKVVICTKFSNQIGNGPNDIGGSRARILNGVETSLKRLRTDYIDIYTMHGYDPVTPLEETLRALDDIVRQGKVRYIACSNFTAWQAMKAAGISREYRLQRFEAVEALYSLGARDVEREIVPMLQDQSMSLMVWGPLSSGILSGKYDRSGHGPAGSRLTFDRDQMLKSDLVAGDVEKAFDALDALKPIAAARGKTTAQIALAWLLHQPAVASVIFGARRPEQIAENVEAYTIDLSAEELRMLSRVNALRTEYPAWKQRLFAKRRAALTG